MLISQLDELIDIQENKVTTNAVGTSKDNWTFLRQLWANVNNTGGSTSYDDDGKVAFTNTIFTMHWVHDVTYNCKIIWQNEIYRIKHIQSLERDRWLRITTIKWDDDD